MAVRNDSSRRSFVLPALMCAAALGYLATKTTTARAQTETSGAPWGDATKMAEEKLARRLNDILSAPELLGADVGLHIRALSDGHTIFEKDAGRLFNPASNVKLVTTAAALSLLGPSFRFKTVAYRDREGTGGIVDGNLYVRGFGDPTLTDEELFGFVNEIALSGIDTVRGDLVLDDSYFDAVFEGPGWEQEHGDRTYAPSIGALSVNYGTFTIRVLPGSGPAALARVLVWPEVPSVRLVNSATTRGAGARARLWLGTSRSAGDKVEVVVRGTIGEGDVEGQLFYRRVYHPTLYAGEHLLRMLLLRGVKVAGKARTGFVSRDASVIATHHSRPLSEVASVLNKTSNNFIAEHIVKALGAEVKGAPGTWEKGTDVISDFLAELGIVRAAFVLRNGSGLNDTNRFSPEHMTRLLEAMSGRPEVATEFMASLAVAGASGTIASRFSNTPAEKKLRAKTGSLIGVSALSGYVTTRDAQTFAFSVMMNNYEGRARTMWRVQDQIGVALAEHDAREFVARPHSSMTPVEQASK